jgi:Flp pilus assembly protein TadD
MSKFFSLAAVWAVSMTLAAADVKPAERLYRRADYRGAIKLLTDQSIQTAEALALMGKSYFMLGEFKRATEYLEKAVASDPQKSEYFHWLGKAYGRRAETSSILTAPGYASKTRQYFEQAVALDPKNLEAINDLFTYYLEAPGFLGGGIDKAAALSEKIKALDPVEYHYAVAQVAERRKQFGTAEEQLRRAVELAPKQAGRVIDLAKFLARQGKVEESEVFFEQAAKISPNNPKLLFERAAAYVNSKRNLDTARMLLKKYLEQPLTPDLPSRAEAEKLLRQAGG